LAALIERDNCTKGELETTMSIWLLTMEHLSEQKINRKVTKSSRTKQNLPIIGLI